MSLDDEIEKAVNEDDDSIDAADQEDDASQEEAEELSRQQRQPQNPNRAERRAIERDQRKQKTYGTLTDGTPITRPRQIDQQPKQRRPQSSVVSKPISRYQEIDNPSSQLTPPGSGNAFVRSRMDQIMETGELAGKNRKYIADEFSKIQADVNAFIVWQANREEYVVYQNNGYDENEGKDRWDPQTYYFNALTMGQHMKLQKILALYNDLVRARDNNDRSVTDVNLQVDRAAANIWKAKAELYFRMYIGKYYHKDTNEEVDADDPDGVLETEDEFEKTNQKDLDLAIQAYEWANLNLSNWKKQRRYERSSMGTNLKRMR